MLYDLTVYEAMKNMKSVIPAMEELAAQYDPDLLFVPDFFPIDVMEKAKATNLRWPGEYWGLPRRYGALEGLGLFNVHGLCAQAPLAFAGAGLPADEARVGRV